MLKKTTFFDKFTGFRSAHCGLYTVSLACSQFLVFAWNFFILAGNKNNYIVSNQFEIRHDSTTYCGVSCHWSFEKKKIPYTYNGENLVSTLEPLFLIGSFSFLQVTRTAIKAWMSSNLGEIQPLTSELAALEWLKKSNYKFFSPLAPSFLIRSSSFLQVTRTTI